MKDKVDTLIVVPNQRILQVVDRKTPILEAFKKIDSVLHQGVKGIAELITIPGLINVDFADVRTIMSSAGTALMGIGTGTGDKRALAAIKQAISSPLLDASIEGARGVLLNIVGGPDMTMNEIDEAASIITKTVDPDADIIFGAVIDEKMMDSVKITLIATKFDEQRVKLFRFKKDDSTPELKKSLDEDSEEEKEDVQTSAPKIEIPDDEELLEENDAFDIPAFLRKK